MADMKFADRASLSGTWQHKDGYLIAEAFAVRTGIQLYAGSEVGMADKAVVRVYRPEDEVKAADSLRSFSHAPVTLGHPNVDVTATNWRDLARGEVSTEAEWKDGKIKLPLIVKDAQAIKAVESGEARELSAGYSCSLEFVDGVTPSGEPYDAVQRNIRINHLALVPAGRAGPECRIGDAANWGVSPMQDKQETTKEPEMSVIPVVLGDKAVNVPADQAPAIQAFADSMKAQLRDAETKHQQAMAAKDAEIAKLTGERDAEKAKQITDAQLDALTRERANLVSVARQIVADVDVTKSNADIRKAVVTKKFGDAAVVGKTDAYFEAAFDILAKDVKPADQFADAFRGTGQQAPAQAFGANVFDMKALTDAAAAAHQKRANALNDAWNPDAGKTSRDMG